MSRPTKDAERAAQNDVDRAIAGVQAVHDAMAHVCVAVANTMEGMGVKEFVPHASLPQQLAFHRLIEEIRQRGVL